MADEGTGVARDPGIVVPVKGIGCSSMPDPRLSGLATTIVGVARTRLLFCRQAGSNSIIRLRIERRMPRLPKGEVVRGQLEKNGCLRSCVAY